MTFVITQGCCNDGSCIAVCPVQCIRPRPGDPDYSTAEQLYIDPATCIDCAACLDECPVNAIHGDYDVPDRLADYVQINADYFSDNPIIEEPEPRRVRRQLPDGKGSLRVAIVGSGPAACYAAGELSEIKGVEVSIFDRLPTPFGLLRSGVAPDHPDTKLIGDNFRAILSRKSVKCFFNVEIGREISIEELLKHHHAIIWAAGAGDDRRLNIPGEDLLGSHSAREFVAWYNGHPDHANDTFSLAGKRAIVVGNGNVALDVARALTRPIAAFERTDMADHAIEALRESAVQEVVVAARRGPENAAYSLPEVLALSQLGGVDLLARTEEVANAQPTPDTPLANRKLDIARRAASTRADPEHRSITLRFLLTPVSINGHEAVESVTFARSEFVEVDDVVSVRLTDQLETIEASLVLRAVGYRGHSVADVPFDDYSGTIPNIEGRVTDGVGGNPVTGLYCSGWIKRGATGVIGTNKTDSIETVEALLKDFAAGSLADPGGDHETLAALVAERQPDVVDNAAWLRINQVERKAGTADRRPRIKFISIDQMLAASRSEG